MLREHQIAVTANLISAAAALYELYLDSFVTIA